MNMSGLLELINKKKGYFSNPGYSGPWLLSFNGARMNHFNAYFHVLFLMN